MSLYQLSKFLYVLNRDEDIKKEFKATPKTVLEAYKLTHEERGAVLKPDIGLLYVLGVNGQLLMHFAALCGIEWTDYLQRMRDGIKIHGQVREGVYTMTTSPDKRVVK